MSKRVTNDKPAGVKRMPPPPPPPERTVRDVTPLHLACVASVIAVAVFGGIPLAIRLLEVN
jgi:hypothetical protein